MTENLMLHIFPKPKTKKLTCGQVGVQNLEDEQKEEEEEEEEEWSADFDGGCRRALWSDGDAIAMMMVMGILLSCCCCFFNNPTLEFCSSFCTTTPPFSPSPSHVLHNHKHIKAQKQTQSITRAHTHTHTQKQGEDDFKGHFRQGSRDQKPSDRFESKSCEDPKNQQC